MEFTLEMKTPLWTGGMNGDMKRVYETGLLGSLRWWFEAIVRGLGGSACDPTESTCDAKSHCDVCHIFGCMGWSKRFRLEIIKEGTKPDDDQEKRITIVPPQNKNKFGWVFNIGNTGVIKGKIDVIRVDETISTEDIEKILDCILTLMSHWAGFGAKNQIGMGIGAYKSSTNHMNFNVKEIIDNLPHNKKSKNNESPDFKEFFFIKVPFEKDPRIDFYKKYSSYIYKYYKYDPYKQIVVRKESSDVKQTFKTWLPIIPFFRQTLRADMKKNVKVLEDTRHKVLGKVLNNDIKYASKIKASNLYYDNKNNQWQMHIWGWLPNNLSKVRGDMLDSWLVNSTNWETLVGTPVVSPLEIKDVTKYSDVESFINALIEETKP